ncbi:hypothetical protein [Salinisphaera hydrothermalis]|uniref:Uncharacterized protein n=1 Tax=Salinisphaera hydrothermalis (strain C41B8) TaxID=1304275 RepID=A0A084INQ2_SALHC|nr:hypothetical protein [Salinisphaera hydrothermalis]KEZ78336.1 hypothetical protein C41B8_05523 [Salinisphaera hydrothermalis C41B8]
MNHPIANGLTGEEAREVVACLLVSVEKHDRRGDTRGLLSDVLTTTQLAERLARGVPDDSAWPNYGEVRLPGLPA